MDTLEMLTPYIPLLQTLCWVLLVSTIAFVLRRQLLAFIGVIRVRIEQASGLKAGPLEIGQDRRTLQYVEKHLDGAEPVQNGSQRRAMIRRTLRMWAMLSSS
jgi:hypothetical protein